jgi:hypothetical protein
MKAMRPGIARTSPFTDLGTTPANSGFGYWALERKKC